MKIKFLADENLRRAVVFGVRRREPSISLLQAFQVGAAGKDALAVLQIAAAEGRISHDVRTMPRYFQEFIHRQSSPGLILVPQKLAPGAAIDELLLLWIASGDYEWVNRICYLPI